MNVSVLTALGQFSGWRR